MIMIYMTSGQFIDCIICMPDNYHLISSLVSSFGSQVENFPSSRVSNRRIISDGSGSVRDNVFIELDSNRAFGLRRRATSLLIAYR